MSDLIWLSAMQMRRIEPYFPLLHGMPRVDDRRLPEGQGLAGDRGYDADWFRAAQGEREIIPPSRQRRTEGWRFLTIPRSTASDTRSRTCSAGSRTGVVSIPATIVAPTLSCQPSASR